MRVLVVDDNATNRQILEKILIHWRMRPSAVDGAKAGLALLKQAQGSQGPVCPDDYWTGICRKWTGSCWWSRFEKTPELAGLVTVMLTSGGHRGDGARCAELGIAAYLMKPVLQSDLLEALSKVLGARREAPRGSESLLPARLFGKAACLCMFCWRKTIASTNGWRRVCWRNGAHVVVLAENGARALEVLDSRASTLSSWMCKCRYWMACKPPRPFGRRSEPRASTFPSLP